MRYVHTLISEDGASLGATIGDSNPRFIVFFRDPDDGDIFAEGMDGAGEVKIMRLRDSFLASFQRVGSAVHFTSTSAGAMYERMAR